MPRSLCFWASKTRTLKQKVRQKHVPLRRKSTSWPPLAPCWFLAPSWPPPGRLLALSWPSPGPILLPGSLLLLAPWLRGPGCLAPWSPRPLLASWLPAPLAPCPFRPLAPWPPAPHAPRALLAPRALGPWHLAPGPWHLGPLAPWPLAPIRSGETPRSVSKSGPLYRSLQPHERASAPPQGSPALCTLSE